MEPDKPATFWPPHARSTIWPLQGRPETIVKCVRDNYCMRRMVFNMPVRCEVNPAMGRESRSGHKLPPAERLIKAPVEQLILKLTGSERLMNLAGSVMKKAG